MIAQGSQDYPQDCGRACAPARPEPAPRRRRLPLAAADLAAALLGLLLRRADSRRRRALAGRSGGEALEPDEAPADQRDQEGERADDR